jgi:hypothetical protein
MDEIAVFTVGVDSEVALGLVRRHGDMMKEALRRSESGMASVVFGQTMCIVFRRELAAHFSVDAGAAPAGLEVMVLAMSVHSDYARTVLESREGRQGAEEGYER